MKLLSDQMLTATEEEVVARFTVPANAQTAVSEQVEFATATLRKAKRPRHDPSTNYMDILRMIPPTSNRCERLFSQCKLILTPLQSSLLPDNFERSSFCWPTVSYGISLRSSGTKTLMDNALISYA